MKIIRVVLKIFLITLLFLIIAFLFMQQKPFGKLPASTRLNAIKKSPNYKNDRFVNIVSTTLLEKGSSYWSLIGKYLGKGENRAPSVTLPFIRTNLQVNQTGEARIVWFGHSSYLISIEGKNILVDPVFSKRASPVQYVGVKSYEGANEYSVDDMPEIDLLIVTHDHYDHLDYNTIVNLKSKVKQYCTPLGVGQHLIHWGIEEKRITELDWWQSTDIFSGFELIATPARHFSGRGLINNKTLWASFVLKTPGYSIFIGGDSGYDNSFKLIGKQYGPFDIAMLECGQYDKQWPYIHMMPEETVQASIDLTAKVLMPVHWAKFTLALHSWKEPIERVTANASLHQVNLTTPIIGEPVLLKKSYPVSQWWTKF